MRVIKSMLPIIGLLVLAACGSSGSSTQSQNAITGVDTASQISVVTAK